MRRILIFVAFVLSCAGSAGAQVLTSRELAGLRGPVRSVRLEVAKSSSATGIVPGSRVVLSINSYDRNGNTVGQTVNNADGSRKWKNAWKHEYDSRGRKIRTDYYDANGVLTSSSITVYDDKDHKAQLSQYNPNGSINHVREEFFDDRGNTVRESFRYPTGRATVNLSTYDAAGKLTEFALTDGAGNLQHKVFRSYDDHGNPVSLIIEQANGQRQQVFKKSLRYDESGNIVEELSYATDGFLKSKETFNYEFDDQRNWTRRTTVRELFTGERSSSESEVSYRRITYYSQ